MLKVLTAISLRMDFNTCMKAIERKENLKEKTVTINAFLNRLNLGSGESSSFDASCSNWRGVMIRGA